MTQQIYSEQDYLNSFLTLLPTGRIWQKTADSNLYQAIASLIPTISRLSDTATELLTDSFIGTTNELLPEWQSSLGLPDPCLPATATFEEQRAQAIARFIGVEGQSVPFLIAYAANLGFVITITEYTTFKAGTGKAGGQITSAAIAFAWTINLPSQTIIYFRAGSAKAGQKLAVLVGDVLQCEITDIQPAHTNVFYNFV